MQSLVSGVNLNLDTPADIINNFNKTYSEISDLKYQNDEKKRKQVEDDLLEQSKYFIQVGRDLIKQGVPASKVPWAFKSPRTVMEDLKKNYDSYKQIIDTQIKDLSWKNFIEKYAGAGTFTREEWEADPINTEKRLKEETIAKGQVDYQKLIPSETKTEIKQPIPEQQAIATEQTPQQITPAAQTILQPQGKEEEVKVPFRAKPKTPKITQKPTTTIIPTAQPIATTQPEVKPETQSESGYDKMISNLENEKKYYEEQIKLAKPNSAEQKLLADKWNDTKNKIANLKIADIEKQEKLELTKMQNDLKLDLANKKNELQELIKTIQTQGKIKNEAEKEKAKKDAERKRTELKNYEKLDKAINDYNQALKLFELSKTKKDKSTEIKQKEEKMIEKAIALKILIEKPENKNYITKNPEFYKILKKMLGENIEDESTGTQEKPTKALDLNKYRNK